MTTCTRPRRASGDTGSIPLALLLLIFVTGMLVMLMLDTARGQKSTTADRRYTLAIHHADAGVQQALYALNRRTREPNFGDPMSGPHPGSITTGTFDWSAVLGADGRTWTVTSRGTYQGRSRTVVAELQRTLRFQHAVLTDRSTRLVGDDVFDTYASPATPPAMSPNLAVLASNGTIRSPASSTSAGGTVLYDYADKPDPQRCVGTTIGCATAVKEPLPAPITSDDDLRFIRAALKVCRDAAGLSPTAELPDWIASRDAVMSGNTAYYAPTATGPACYRNVVFDRNVRFRPAPGKPAVLYVEGRVTVAKSTLVNIAPGEPAPTAADLQIYSAHSGSVDWDTGSRFAGAVFAPRAACGGRGGGSVEIYGAVVCGTFASRGGMRFHYDLSLRTMIGNSVSIISWRER